MNLLATLLYLLFPRESSYSTSIYSYIDTLEIQRAKEYFKKPASSCLSQVYVSLPYRGQMSALIERVKLGGEYDIAIEISQIFAHRVWSESAVFIPTPDIVVPVPADPKRLNQRGFHLSTILAQEVAKTIQKDNESTRLSNLLLKSKNTRPQSSLSKTERKNNNSDNIFQINSQSKSELPYCETIWLIDDIVATQSTISECAKILKKEFPEVAVYAVILCGN